ncbi:MAG: HAD family phosphatase [Clostridia bacterium]|nr:HAD family phosphatase [Clostridia bacterium]
MRSVIFDFNGTLFPDADKHREAWKRFLVKYGKGADDGELRSLDLGRTTESVLRGIFGEKISKADISAHTLEKEAIYRDVCREDPTTCRLTAGAPEFFDFLKAEGVDFTIATGCERTNVDFYFDEFKLGKWFDRTRVVLDDGTFPGKPAPDVYLRAAKILGREPADCVAFEDSLSGVRAAYAAGIGRIVAITTDVSAERLLGCPGVEVAEPDFTNMKKLWAEVLYK